MVIYPEDSHPLASAHAQADQCMQLVMWANEHLGRGGKSAEPRAPAAP